MRQWKLYLLLAFIFTFSLSFIHAQQVDNQVDSLPQIDTIASVRRYIPEFTPQQVNTRSSFLISSITVVGNKKTRSNIILREVPDMLILAISMHALPAYARRMFQMGAKGYVTKNSSKEEL